MRNCFPLAINLLLAVLTTLALTCCTNSTDGSPLDTYTTKPEQAAAGKMSRVAPGSESSPEAPRTPGRYPTAQPNSDEDLPPHPDSDQACDLMSWKALDQRVWPLTDKQRPPGPDNPPDPNGTQPHVKHVPKALPDSRWCHLGNTLFALASDSSDEFQYFIVNLALGDLGTLSGRTTIRGKPATIQEVADACTIIVELGDEDIGVDLTNTRFHSIGLEPCTLARQAAEWAVNAR
jgi:hypothetical protein